MSRAVFDRALAAARRLHQDPRLADFVRFESGAFDPPSPHHIPAADRMLAETCFANGPYAAVAQDLMAPAAFAEWRETYQGTHLANDFLQRFACYRLLGPEGPFKSNAMAGYVLYTTAALDYPWHHHPAEELYLILGGEAEFQAKGEPAQMLRAGDVIYHAVNQPHRMTTHAQPVLCWVVWRPPNMDVRPVLTPQEVIG